MNKAFIREQDQAVEHCPRCGSLGQPVGRVTLDAHIPPSLRADLADTAVFCPYPQCEVGYFDAFERTITTDALAKPVYPKDAQAPICACFGLTIEDIERDVDEGSVARVKALLEKANSDQARCATAAANGRSCVPEVQRCYMKLRGGR